MSSYSEILDKALRIQRENVLGIQKDAKEYAFVFVYPPQKCLEPIDENTILVSEIEKNVAKSLYIHIPYCTGRCTYCYFCCYPLQSAPIPKKKYVELLCDEIKLVREKYGRQTISSIHIGGGTPTTLTEQEFEALFKCINDNFVLQSDIEITCESSPETLTLDKIKLIRTLGVNRLNIGVESFNDQILKSMNRRHSSKKAIERIACAQENGFENINIDLIYGMPEESLDDWKNTLSIATSLNVQSISTYRLRIHPNGLMNSALQQLGEELLIKKYIETLRHMKDNNYLQASSHKFALEREFVQKQIVKKRGVKENELIAIGLSAYGFLANTVFWNARKLEDYECLLKQRKLPVEQGYVLDLKEKIAKASVLGLHNLKGINLDDIESEYGIKFVDYYSNLVDPLIQEGLCYISDNRFQLTELGMIFADEIATMFYSEQIKKILNQKNSRFGIFFDDVLFEKS